MYFKLLILIGFLHWVTTHGQAQTVALVLGQAQTHIPNIHCNTSLGLCPEALKPEILPTITPRSPPKIYSGRDIYERSWTKILPIFFLILFGTLCIHCCHRCHTRSSRVPQPQVIPSAPTAPTPPLLSPPLVVTFASIHSNPFEQHMTPHTASLLVRPSISEADPRARPPIRPLLHFSRGPFDTTAAVPSAPSAELVVTPQTGRPLTGNPDLPPPYHLALQLEEPPPPYSEIHTATH